MFGGRKKRSIVFNPPISGWAVQLSTMSATFRFSKTIFYFLRASEYHCCRVQVEGKAINQGDDKGMKVPCTLLFKGQSEFVDILSHELKKTCMYVNKPEIVLKETFFLFFHRSNQPSDALKSLHPNSFAK